MSAAVELTEPAAAITSMSRHGIARCTPPMKACGITRLGARAAAASPMLVSRIPSGAKMRWRTTSSYGIPAAAAIASPAYR
ncbi:MAG TPA: hypothetical protein VJT67_06310 [Longimicrobiaceae bacterium]|nr:hypothetical protein [Longimicrobiaceae bacterium]